MNDNDVIEIAKICSGSGCDASCTFDDGTITTDECMGALIRSLCDIIKRKDTEIDILIRKKETLKDELAEKQAEIERLQDIAKGAWNECINVCDSIMEAKSKARKEFWERLKTQNTMDERIVSVKSGDNLLEEMESERE